MHLGAWVWLVEVGRVGTIQLTPFETSWNPVCLVPGWWHGEQEQGGQNADTWCIPWHGAVWHRDGSVQELVRLRAQLRNCRLPIFLLYHDRGNLGLCGESCPSLVLWNLKVLVSIVPVLQMCLLTTAGREDSSQAASDIDFWKACRNSPVGSCPGSRLGNAIKPGRRPDFSSTCFVIS